MKVAQEMVSKALPYLSKLPSDPYKDILTQELSKITRYETEDIQSRILEVIPATNSKKTTKKQVRRTKSKVLKRFVG